MSHLPFLITVGVFFNIKKVMFAISHAYSLTVVLDPDCPSTDHKHPTVKNQVFSARSKSHKCFILVETEIFLIFHTQAQVSVNAILKPLKC